MKLLGYSLQRPRYSAHGKSAKSPSPPRFLMFHLLVSSISRQVDLIYCFKSSRITLTNVSFFKVRQWFQTKDRPSCSRCSMFQFYLSRHQPTNQEQQATNRPNDQPTEGPKPPTKQPTRQPTNQPTNQSSKQGTQHSLRNRYTSLSLVLFLPFCRACIRSQWRLYKNTLTKFHSRPFLI